MRTSTVPGAEAVEAAAPSPGALVQARRRRPLARALLEVWAGLTGLFLLAPLAIVVVNSLGVEQYVIFPPTGLSLGWYGRIPSYYLDGALYSLGVATLAVLAGSLLAIPTAIAITRGVLPGRAAIDALLRSPIQIPLLISGVAFLQFYVLLYDLTRLTLMNSFVGLWIAHTVVVSPFILVAVVARLARYDERQDEAAYGLGASRWQTFWLVTFPQLQSAIAAGMFFGFLMSFDNVPLTIFLIQSGQTTLPLALFFDSERDLSRIQYAVGTLVTVVSTTLILLAMRRLGILPSEESVARA
jgi:putative spermidine/putrescine transport system permease protein